MALRPRNAQPTSSHAYSIKPGTEPDEIACIDAIAQQFVLEPADVNDLLAAAVHRWCAKSDPPPPPAAAAAAEHVARMLQEFCTGMDVARMLHG